MTKYYNETDRLNDYSSSWNVMTDRKHSSVKKIIVWWLCIIDNEKWKLLTIGNDSIIVIYWRIANINIPVLWNRYCIPVLVLSILVTKKLIWWRKPSYSEQASNKYV